MDVREILCEMGAEDAVVFDNPDYDAAIIGTTEDGRAVYDYELMRRVLEVRDGMEETEALEWLDYNTLRAIPYAGPMAPVVVFPLMENPDADRLFRGGEQDERL